MTTTTKKKPLKRAIVIPQAAVIACPYCHSTDLGTLDTVQVCARVHWDAGELKYVGDTEIFWDTQKTQRSGQLFCISCTKSLGLPEDYDNPS